MDIERRGNTLFLRGRWTLSVVDELEEAAGALDLSRLVRLDVAGLAYISSAGLSSLLCLRRQVEKAGGRLQLIGPGGLVRQVLEMAGLLAVLT